MKKILKFFYKIIPFKKQMFLILKGVFNLKHNVYSHLHFKGKFNIKVNASSSFQMMHYGYEIENEIFWNGLEGGWEKHSIDVWKKLSNDSKVVFDVGANTGVFGLITKSISPDSKVYAFEPVERVYSKLKENISLNNSNIVPVMSALSNYNGKAIIHDPMSEHVYSVTVNKNNFDNPDLYTKEVEIDVLRMDTFIEEHSISNIDLLKIDVETHEAEVLEGMGVYLEKFKPTMLIEILTQEVAENVEKIIGNMNYLYFNIDEENGLFRCDKLKPSSTFNFLVCNEDVAKSLKLL